MKKVINKGMGTQPKYDRNKEMMDRYVKGVPMLTLQIDYGISAQRIHEIRRSMKIPPVSPKKVKKHKK